MMADKIQYFIKRNETPFLEELKQFLRIPSVSPMPEHTPDVRRAAEFVADQLRRAHLENVELIPTAQHPLIYADWLHAPNKPTVLCYGHYDVQPAEPMDEWRTPPFEPTVQDGVIYARGASDSKGQMYTHIKAVQTLWDTTGTLPVNIKFLIEGEEEIGGESIASYLEHQGGKLTADVALISDTSLFAPRLPTLVTGLRGLVYFEVQAEGAGHDLDSGIYGGVAPNPIFGLLELVAKIKGRDGRIAIPRFYDRVAKPSAEELRSWQSLRFNQKSFLAEEISATAFGGEDRYSVLHRLWARPSFDVHGILGGFAGEGVKTVIPTRAAAKCSFRLVPNQDPDEVVAAFRSFVANNTPEGLQMRVLVRSAGRPWSVNIHSKPILSARKALAIAFGKEPVLIRSGGSIPIVADITQFLNIPAVIMGFSDPDDRSHSANERFALQNYYSGITAVARFLDFCGGTRLEDTVHR